MDHNYDDKQLTITIDDDEKAELAEIKADDPDHFRSTDALFAFFEPLVANSELQWIDPSDTGDLTDAPMLGILGEEGMKNHTVFLDNFGLVECGKRGHWTYAQPILNRWAFMDYQVDNPLEVLLNKGEIVFVA